MAESQGCQNWPQTIMKQLSFNVFIVRKNREGSVGRFKDLQKLIY